MSADPFRNATVQVVGLMQALNHADRVSILAFAEFLASRHTEKCNRPKAVVIPLTISNMKAKGHKQIAAPA